MARHGRNVWVVRDGERYVIREEGRQGALVSPISQRIAIRIARLIAKANRAELIIQGKNGKIRSRDSHGFDSPYKKG
jgi:antitoxin (DNA-binding transcriptional repressor) of toxin-antitoxin stability system